MSPARGHGCRKNEAPRAKRAIGKVGSLPNGINTTPASRRGKSPMTRPKPLGPCCGTGMMHQSENGR